MKKGKEDTKMMTSPSLAEALPLFLSWWIAITLSLHICLRAWVKCRHLIKCKSFKASHSIELFMYRCARLLLRWQIQGGKNLMRKDLFWSIVPEPLEQGQLNSRFRPKVRQNILATGIYDRGSSLSQGSQKEDRQEGARDKGPFKDTLRLLPPTSFYHPTMFY